MTIPIPDDEIPGPSASIRYPSAWTERLDATLPWFEQRSILEDGVKNGVHGGLACVLDEPLPEGGLHIEFLEITLTPWPHPSATRDELEHLASVLGAIVSGMVAAL